MSSNEHVEADNAAFKDHDADAEGVEDEGPDLSGTVLDGRYHLLHRLGAGGMGVVYVANHLKLRTRVAVKLLKHQFSSPYTKHRKRFLREAQAAATIQDPNVVRIMDFGETEDNKVYFVMEFIEGKDLGELLEELGSMPWQRVRDIALQVASALAAAHSHGIIHRDVKPSNCVIFDDARRDTKDAIKVLDFGIAKVNLEGDKTTEALTGTDELFGTVAYMAPELVDGTPASPASDIYALGVMLFRMLTGRLPFEGPTPLKVLTLHLTEEPPRPREIKPSIPVDVEALILRCLEKQPEGRFSGMEELAVALRSIRDKPSNPTKVISDLSDEKWTDNGVRHNEKSDGGNTLSIIHPGSTEVILQPPAEELRQEPSDTLSKSHAGDQGGRLKYTMSIMAMTTIFFVITWYVISSISPTKHPQVDQDLPSNALADSLSDTRKLAAPEPNRSAAQVSDIGTKNGKAEVVKTQEETPEATPILKSIEQENSNGATEPIGRDSNSNKTTGKRVQESSISIIRRRVKKECSLPGGEDRAFHVSGPVGSDGYLITARVPGANDALISCITRIAKSQRFSKSKGRMIEFSI
jgi:serine/threonine protein kinase